jgi:hypothetical protein
MAFSSQLLSVQKPKNKGKNTFRKKIIQIYFTFSIVIKSYMFLMKPILELIVSTYFNIF